MKKTFLLVDDDRDDQQLLAEAFQATHQEVEIRAVSSAREALQYLELHHNTLPHLLIVDYNMPDHNGAELLDMIAAQPDLSRIPVVVWSTSDSGRYREICERKGARAYFRKPERFQDLVALTVEIFPHAR